MIQWSVSAMAVLVSFSVITVVKASPSFQGLGDLSGPHFFSLAKSVSADGKVVVGESESDSPFDGPGKPSPVGREAFRWTRDEGMVGLGDLPSNAANIASSASAVSADGSIILGHGSNGSTFRWTQQDGLVDLQGIVTTSHFLEGSGAADLSTDGSILVGSGAVGTDFEAGRWSASEGLIGLGTLPDSVHGSFATAVSADGAVVVGQSDRGGVLEAFRWTHASGMVGLGDLPGAPQGSQAFDVSADGSVVVGAGNRIGGAGEAFRWTEGVGLESLGDLSGGILDSHAYAVSADGSVVAGRGTTEIGAEAFLWDETNGMRNLNKVLEVDLGLELNNWTLRQVNGISADGLTLVGQGINPDGFSEGWIAVIPEPGTCVLMMGVLIVWGSRRRGALHARFVVS